MNRIKLMIVDDHTLFREGMKALLAVTDDIEIVGEAEDGDSVVERSRQVQPDVILMDINMPGLNGIRATEQILERQPQTRIIMLTMLEDDASVFHAMRAGARGYLLKGADPQEVLNVIRAVADGQALFGPAIATRLLNYFKELSTKPAWSQAGTTFSRSNRPGIGNSEIDRAGIEQSGNCAKAGAKPQDGSKPYYEYF